MINCFFLFQQFDCTCWCGTLLSLSCLKLFEPLECVFFFFWIWEILALISSNTLSFCLSPIICRSVFLMVSQVSESLICFWFFFLFHSVSQTDWCQLTCFQVHWFLIYYWAAVSTFSFIFFISSYITQTYNFYLIFFRKYFFYIKIVSLVETLFSYSSLVVLTYLK